MTLPFSDQPEQLHAAVLSYRRRRLWAFRIAGVILLAAAALGVAGQYAAGAMLAVLAGIFAASGFVSGSIVDAAKRDFEAGRRQADR